MALNGLFCADVPLRNYSLTLCLLYLMLAGFNGGDTGSDVDECRPFCGED